MSIYTNVFSYYIWSFKACLTYQLLNSTLYIMVSWNAERVHNVHVGDNAFFLFIIFVDGFLVWYPCGIYCKHTMALFWLEKKKMLPQKATHPWVAILPSAHRFWSLYLLFNKLQKFLPKPLSQFGTGWRTPSCYLATGREDVWEPQERWVSAPVLAAAAQQSEVGQERERGLLSNSSF